jgi:hypothetical protein
MGTVLEQTGAPRIFVKKRISDLDKAGTAWAPGDPTRWCRHAIEDSRHRRHTHRVWKEAEHRLIVERVPNVEEGGHRQVGRQSGLGKSRVGRVNGRDEDASRPDLRRPSLPR